MAGSLLDQSKDHFNVALLTWGVFLWFVAHRIHISRALGLLALSLMTPPLALAAPLASQERLRSLLARP